MPTRVEIGVIRVIIGIGGSSGSHSVIISAIFFKINTKTKGRTRCEAQKNADGHNTSTKI
jgi:hypothetical protein